MLFTIRNDFHNTTAVIKAEPGQKLSASQVWRCFDKLCGSDDCKCGGTLGQRGPQDCDIIPCHGSVDTVALKPKCST